MKSQKRTGLATSINDTYISIAAELIRDVAGRPVTPVINAESKIATNFTADTTQPELKEFFLNVNNGRLTFAFTETVNISTLNVSVFTLQNTASSVLATETLSLAGATPTMVGFEDTFDIMLTTSSLNMLKTSTFSWCVQQQHLP